MLHQVFPILLLLLHLPLRCGSYKNKN
jgi:hypothetical protein